MIKSVRHLCGSRDEWAENDFVIPKGELTVTIDTPTPRIKIGDGVTLHSKLPYLNGDYQKIKGNSQNVTLENGVFLNFTTSLRTLVLHLPDEYSLDYMGRLCFKSGSSPTEFSAEDIYFTGDDCYNGVLIPKGRTDYTLVVFYANGFHGVVRGVYDV